MIKVEPYWNVNQTYASLSEPTKDIKVEPYWNVNSKNCKRKKVKYS